jgi:exopolyphosphatase/guanosine-5'-triphosphate,3'-diphosphate pyrophosphatase
VQEAELTFRGLAYETDLSGNVMVADIGGGSTEIIAARDGTMVWSRSLALGSGRLTDRWVQHDPPTASELAACRREAERCLDDAGVPARPWDRLMVLGGTGEYLLRLISGGGPARPEDVDRVLGLLMTIPAAELAARLTIPIERARVLPAGIAIASALAGWVHPHHIEGARSGIRLGLLLAAFAGER